MNLNLEQLRDALNRAYPDQSKSRKLYTDHFMNAVMAEGFTEEQARLIEYEAYERGHSAGCAEIVCITFGIVGFAKKLLATK